MDENIKTIIPYFGTLFIIFGAIKLIIFFSFFNVDITSFLEFTEILTLFLNDILMFGSAFLIVMIFNFLTIPKHEEENSAQSISKAVDEKNVLKRLKHYSDTGPDMIIVTIVYLIMMIIGYFINGQIWSMVSFYLIFLSGFFIKVFVLEIRRQYFIKFEKYPKFIFIQMLLICLLFLGITIRKAYTQYDHIKNKKKYVGTEIIIDNKSIISTKSYYYIGKTRNYVFFYNEMEKSCDIFPMQIIQKLKVRTAGNS